MHMIFNQTSCLFLFVILLFVRNAVVPLAPNAIPDKKKPNIENLRKTISINHVSFIHNFPDLTSAKRIDVFANNQFIH